MHFAVTELLLIRHMSSNNFTYNANSADFCVVSAHWCATLFWELVLDKMYHMCIGTLDLLLSAISHLTHPAVQLDYRSYM